MSDLLSDERAKCAQVVEASTQSRRATDNTGPLDFSAGSRILGDADAPAPWMQPMTTLAALAVSLPLETLPPGAQLTSEGSYSGRLYLLESGRLAVSREGVALATIEEPGAIIGEMAVLLGIPHSATVTAEVETQVRVIDEALDVLGQISPSTSPPSPAPGSTQPRRCWSSSGAPQRARSRNRR